MMMKKATVFLAVLILFSFTACDTIPPPEEYADLPDTYCEGTDFPINFGNVVAAPPVMPEENGYYFFAGQFLHYLDKETMTATTACNRPECRHWDIDCPAHYARGQMDFTQYYNGKVYVVTHERNDQGYFCWLYTANPSEGTREKVCQLPYGEYDNVTYMMHRGYLYMVVRETQGESVFGTLRIERVALNELKEKSLEPEILFEIESGTMSQRPFLFGDHCFLGSAAIRNGAVETFLLDVDLKTGEARELHVPNAEEGSYATLDVASNDQLVIHYLTPEAAMGETLDKEYYTYDPESGEIELLTVLKDRGTGIPEFLLSDGTNWIGSYFDYSASIDKQELRILDENFNTVKSILPNVFYEGLVTGDEEFTFIGENTGYITLYAIDKRGDELELIEIINTTADMMYIE